MDLDFGISLDPSVVTQRHTLYDSDEEETELENPEEVFTVEAVSNDSYSGCNLIIAVGVQASIFTRSYLVLESTSVCRVTSTSPTVVKDRYFAGRDDTPLTISEVYEAKCTSGTSKYLVCLHEKQVKSEFTNLWCSKVFKHIRPDSVLILTSRPSIELFSPHGPSSDTSSDHSGFLRVLQSSKWTQPPIVTSTLESPNTIAGEAAAALTHCQVHGLPGSMVVFYADSSQSMAERVNGFHPVLKHPLLSGALLIKSSTEANHTIKTLTPRPREDLSTLYT